jgi:hypothetical protein
MSMTAGTVSPTVVISVVGHNGFIGAVGVAITGLPPGGLSSPASPLTLPVSESEQALIFVPPATPNDSLSIDFIATSGSRSHSATLTLTVTPVSNTAVLQVVSVQTSAGTIEIQGLSVGAFNPDYWQKKHIELGA